MRPALPAQGRLRLTAAGGGEVEVTGKLTSPACGGFEEVEVAGKLALPVYGGFEVARRLAVAFAVAAPAGRGQRREAAAAAAAANRIGGGGRGGSQRKSVRRCTIDRRCGEDISSIFQSRYIPKIILEYSWYICRISSKCHYSYIPDI